MFRRDKVHQKATYRQLRIKGAYL